MDFDVEVENAGRPVSRVLYPPERTVTIYLAPDTTRAVSPCEAGQRYRWGRAANPGTGRTPIVPLFGLAPGGVWPPVRRRTRPDALTVRFRPYRFVIDAPAVCFCATFRPRRSRPRQSLGVTQHPVRRSPDFPPRGARPRGGHPAGPAFSTCEASMAMYEGQATPTEVSVQS